MKQEHYDIFISYRRTAYDTANLIAVKLRHAGYKVFFDVDTLTAGKFNEQLLEVIKGCKDFILVLPENALDRCKDPEDWVRREALCAIKNQKNILPVMLDGFSWPKEMPEGLEDLPKYQAITAVGHEYFDLAIQRMIGYLKSRATKPIKLLFARGGIALAIILLIIGIVFGIISYISNVTCNSVGTQLSAGMDVMENLGQDEKKLKDGLKTFYQLIDTAKDSTEIANAENNLQKTVRTIEKNLEMYRKLSPAPEFSFNSIESYILAYYKTGAEELNAFSAYFNSMLDDMENLKEATKGMVDADMFSQIERDEIATNMSCFEHSLDAFYYGYLGTLSILPKSARKIHFEISRKWTCFPNGTPLDLTQEEYEQFQTKEMERCAEEMELLKEKELRLLK